MHYVLMSIVEIIFQCLVYVFDLFRPILRSLFKQSFSQIGIEINGNNAGDLKVIDERFYAYVAAKGATGFFEAFILKYFECEEPEVFFMKLIENQFFVLARHHPYRYCKYWVHRYFDILDIKNTEKYVNIHYDKMASEISEVTDSTRHYSTMFLEDVSAIENSNSEELRRIMDDGVFRKRELIAKKLKLKPGMTVLDIGCGYGGLVKHLAERYDAHVTGVTITRPMAEFAKKQCDGLEVDIHLMDYRRMTGKFDRIVSMEMFEHVGENHHREYFEKVNSLLKDDGLFVFQCHHASHQYVPSYEPLFEKSLEMYCYFPRIEEICLATKGLLIIEDVQNHGFRCGVTSKAMVKAFRHLDKESLIAKYDETYTRTQYIYGCLAVAGGLTAIDRVYEYVFSKNGLKYAYNYQ